MNLYDFLTKLNRNEKGQALPLALVVLTLGSILVASFFFSIDTRITNVDVYEKSEFRTDIVEAAADYVTELIETANYSIDDVPDSITLNGITANFSIVEDGAVSDLSGGTFNDTEGFSEWEESRVDLTEEPPGSGEYVATIIKHAYLQFMVDVDETVDLILRVHAMVNFGKSNDLMVLNVSTDEINWVPVYSWDINDNSTEFVTYEIDLNSYNLTQPFWIRFDSEIQWGNADFYFDEIKIVSGYSVVVTIVEDQ